MLKHWRPDNLASVTLHRRDIMFPCCSSFGPKFRPSHFTDATGNAVPFQQIIRHVLQFPHGVYMCNELGVSESHTNNTDDV